eukprot:scaffold306_cov525-Prasinococcus_capsulatus_cf.AAC.58
MTDPARENEEEGDDEQPDEEEMATVASSEPPAGMPSVDPLAYWRKACGNPRQNSRIAVCMGQPCVCESHTL